MQLSDFRRESYGRRVEIVIPALISFTFCSQSSSSDERPVFGPINREPHEKREGASRSHSTDSVSGTGKIKKLYVLAFGFRLSLIQFSTIFNKLTVHIL